MEDDGLGLIVLGIFAVLMFISIVFLPLGIVVWYYAYGKESHKQHQKDQQEARERLIARGVVSSDKWC